MFWLLKSDALANLAVDLFSLRSFLLFLKNEELLLVGVNSRFSFFFSSSREAILTLKLAIFS
jgi:hypothetical protein